MIAMIECIPRKEKNRGAAKGIDGAAPRHFLQGARGIVRVEVQRHDRVDRRQPPPWSGSKGLNQALSKPVLVK